MPEGICRVHIRTGATQQDPTCRTRQVEQAAIRPATIDRRPLLGLHPENPCLGIVNGMGTKGASLAPYFVRQFVEYILEGKELNNEANIERVK